MLNRGIGKDKLDPPFIYKTMDIYESICKIDKQCFKTPWTRESMVFEITHPLSVSVVEQRDGKVAAFAVGRVIADEAEIMKIATLAEYRRQGIARMMMTELLDKMRGKGALTCYLEAASKNAAAIALYKSMGFEEISVREQYYGDDDAITMRLEL